MAECVRVKVFGTSMWCYTMWTGLNRFVSKTCRRNEYMAAQKTAQEVMDGEDAVVLAMRRFANDAKCVEYLGSFKEDTEAKVASYRAALAAKMKDELAERALKQLQAIATFEAGMNSAMQEIELGHGCGGGALVGDLSESVGVRMYRTARRLHSSGKKTTSVFTFPWGVTHSIFGDVGFWAS